MNKFMQLNFLGIAFFTVIISHANEHNVNKSFNSTAKIENICNLEVQDINFGVISLPLTTQSANSEMNILCTNNTAYEIKIKYNNKSGDVPGLKITRAGDGVPQGNGPEYNVYIDEKKLALWHVDGLIKIIIKEKLSSQARPLLIFLVLPYMEVHLKENGILIHMEPALLKPYQVQTINL